MKAKYEDHLITVRQVVLTDGQVIAPGTHGFVIEAFDTPHESYEVELSVERESDPGSDDLILALLAPEDFDVA